MSKNINAMYGKTGLMPLDSSVSASPVTGDMNFSGATPVNTAKILGVDVAMREIHPITGMVIASINTFWKMQGLNAAVTYWRELLATGTDIDPGFIDDVENVIRNYEEFPTE